MEGNKDEAERCVELGEKYLAEGKYEKAEKFLNKGQKLFPTAKAEGECENCLVRTVNYSYPLSLSRIFVY